MRTSSATFVKTFDILAVGIGVAAPVWVWAVSTVGFWILTSRARLAWRLAAAGWLALALLGVAPMLTRLDLLRIIADRLALVLPVGFLFGVLLLLASLTGRRLLARRT